MKKGKTIKPGEFFREIYIKLFKINDTPQRVSLGFGVGVFTGIFPGTGPVAALFLALVLRVNRAAALLGSLLTNTWMSFVIFLVAVKTGSSIMRTDWAKVQHDWGMFIADFKWANLFKSSVLGLILPVMLGYLVVGLVLGIAAYLISLALLIGIKKLKQKD